MIESKRKDEIIAFLIRLWVAGAICFMLLWSTQVSFSFLDTLFLLSLSHLFVERYLVTPFIRNAYKTRTSYFKPGRYYKTLTRIGLGVMELFKMLLIVILVIATYNLLNMTFISMFKLHADTIVLPVEPFSYALIFNIFFYLGYYLHTSIIIKYRKNRIGD